MIRTFARTLRRTVVILLAVGVITLGAYAFSMSSLASSMSDEHGGPPAAMMTTTTTDTSAATSDIVLVDYVSADTSTVAQTVDSTTTDTTTAATTQTQRPMMGGGGHGSSGSITQILQSAAPNLGIMVAVSAAIAAIQTVLKRRKKSRKLTLAAA